LRDSSERNQWLKADEGTPQGGSISVLLSNQRAGTWNDSCMNGLAPLFVRDANNSHLTHALEERDRALDLGAHMAPEMQAKAAEGMPLRRIAMLSEHLRGLLVTRLTLMAAN
jgi:hypothetical protein